MKNQLKLKDLITEALRSTTYTGPNMVPPEDSHKYYFTRNSKALGAFGTVLNNSDYTLLPLDSFDKNYVKGVKLKPNEQIYRFETDRSKIGKLTPLIKLNIQQGLVYFLVVDSPSAREGDDVPPAFETRGVKLRWLHMLK